MSARRPDFFLIGAPKSGTTALSEYLRAHPRIGFARPKEPFFFSTDLPGYRIVDSEAAYLRRCFRHCGPSCRAIGEGSATYLYSETAVPEILEFEPRAKFLVLVRNPVEVAHALHGQFVFDFMEDETDFERAWELQTLRREGRRIPTGCPEPRLLQYREVAALGTQLERLLDRVPRARVHLILFDDFVADTRRAYEATLAFLGVASDGRTRFPRVNPSRRHRFPALGRLVRDPPAPVRRAIEGLKSALDVGSLGVAKRLDPWTTRRAARPPLRPAFRRRLEQAFDEEIGRIEQVFGRDLGHWRTAGGTQHGGG